MASSDKKIRLTDLKRISILEAAVSEFQEYGYDGTSMDRIASTADVSKRTVYNHFPSKDDLFKAIIKEQLSCTVKDIGIDYDPDESLEEQLSQMGVQYAESMAADDFMKLARVVISRFIEAPEIAAATIGDKKDFGDGIESWIKAADKDGRLDVPDAQFAAQQFCGLINEFSFWPQLIGSQKKLTRKKMREVVESSVAMFLHHYAT